MPRGWLASRHACARSSHASAAEGLLRSFGAQGLEEAKSFNTRLSRLRLLTDASAPSSPARLIQPLRLIHLKPTVLLTPAEVRLLHDPGLLTCPSRRLPVRYGHFDLPEQVHHLLRLMLLASSHMLSLSSVSLLHWHSSSRARQLPVFATCRQAGNTSQDRV